MSELLSTHKIVLSKGKVMESTSTNEKELDGGVVLIKALQ